MKAIIPTVKLNESSIGVKIDRISDDYIILKKNEISKFHRNDFYVCILLEKGKMNFTIDFKEIKLGANSLIILAPHQILKVLKSTKVEGWILYFESRLINDGSRLILEDSMYRDSTLSLSDEQQKWFLQIMDLLSLTSNLTDLKTFYNATLQSLLSPFLNRITALFHDSAVQSDDQHSSRSSSIVSSFRKLLRQNYKEIKSPQEYAKMMNFSLGYINDTLKTVSGNTVSQSIQEEVIREAQRLLWYSDLNIKEISNELGYDDPKYFSRIFTKLMGVSPVQFRNNYQNDF